MKNFFSDRFPKKLLRWIKFELSDTVTDMKYFSEDSLDSVPKLNESYVKKLNKFDHRSILLVYFNKIVIKNDNLISFKNLNFFFNDIDFIDDEILKSKNFFSIYNILQLDRPIMAGLFHFDNHPFHEGYFEPEQFYSSLYSDIMLTTRFPLNLAKPVNYFFSNTILELKSATKSHIEELSATKMYPNYYITRALLSLYMDEERFYVTLNKFKKALLRYSIIFLFVILFFYMSSFVMRTFFLKILWKLAGTRYIDFVRELTFFRNKPIVWIRKKLWNCYLFFKLTFIFIYDIIAMICALGSLKKMRRYVLIDERSKKKKRKKFSKLFHRWFW